MHLYLLWMRTARTNYSIYLAAELLNLARCKLLNLSILLHQFLDRSTQSMQFYPNLPIAEYSNPLSYRILSNQRISLLFVHPFQFKQSIKGEEGEWDIIVSILSEKRELLFDQISSHNLPCWEEILVSPVFSTCPSAFSPRRCGPINRSMGVTPTVVFSAEKQLQTSQITLPSYLSLYISICRSIRLSTSIPFPKTE